MSKRPSHDAPAPDPDPDDSVDFDSSLDVMARAKAGDLSAARVLIERTVGPLKQWARRRLPGYARAGANTDDIVQDAVMRALRRLDRFEYRTVDGLQAYLRQSVRNRIKDEIRRVTRHGIAEELPYGLQDEGYSPLEEMILKEQSERYLAALRTLRPEDRLAIIFRLEHRRSFDVIAEKLGKASPDAARMAVSRALKRLADVLNLSAT